MARTRQERARPVYQAICLLAAAVSLILLAPSARSSGQRLAQDLRGSIAQMTEQMIHAGLSRGA